MNCTSDYIRGHGGDKFLVDTKFTRLEQTFKPGFGAEHDHYLRLLPDFSPSLPLCYISSVVPL